MTGSFGAQSTTEDVLAGVDLSGLCMFVTGVSAGLGLETARAAAAHGARVIGTARDLDKARGALAPYAALGIEIVECDLASLASIRACADALNARREKLDVVIANAGVMNCPMGHTADGFETHFGTNHLGHFVLVNRIARLLSDRGRVVSLSSRAHQRSDVDLDDPNFERTAYDPFMAYGRSKTANILFAVGLDRRLRRQGIRAAALHPGGIRTELMRHTTPEMMKDMIARSSQGADGAQVGPPTTKTVEQGAATSIWAAFVAPAEQVGGRYCEDCHVAEPAKVGRDGVRPYALDPQRAEALWVKSEDMVGERFA